MKKHLCDICKSSFKTLEAKEFHESIPLNSLNYSLTTIKNKNKYFLLVKTHNITRKHSETYTITYFYKYLIENNLFEQFKIKKSGYEIPATEITKRLDSGEFQEVRKEEFDKILQFLNNKFKQE